MVLIAIITVYIFVGMGVCIETWCGPDKPGFAKFFDGVLCATMWPGSVLFIIGYLIARMTLRIRADNGSKG